VIFKRHIHHEDEYLQKQFGKAYAEYRRRVNAVIPVPRFWR
jgi:protein-S-isoprenylcysteine O-methyltransferase Ste14